MKQLDFSYIRDQNLKLKVQSDQCCHFTKSRINSFQTLAKEIELSTFLTSQALTICFASDRQRHLKANRRRFSCDIYHRNRCKLLANSQCFVLAVGKRGCPRTDVITLSPLVPKWNRQQQQLQKRNPRAAFQAFKFFFRLFLNTFVEHDSLFLSCSLCSLSASTWSEATCLQRPIKYLTTHEFYFIKIIRAWEGTVCIAMPLLLRVSN